MMQTVFIPLLGGVLIGLAVSLMLLFNGRVTGISGIISKALGPRNQDSIWRFTFLVGLLSGGLLLRYFQPEVFLNTSGRSLTVIVLAGLLVGYGTVMGSGCTSGHGVCGISRFSFRSFLATVTFMLFGFLSVALMRFLL